MTAIPPKAPRSISVDFRGVAAAEIELTAAQQELLREVVAEFRRGPQGPAASTFILGEVFMHYGSSPSGKPWPRLRFYCAPRALGILINRTIRRFFERQKDEPA
jgi:hypothetical protein